MKKILILGFVLSLGLLARGQDNWALSPSIGLNMIPLFEDDAAGKIYKPSLNASVSFIQSIDEQLSLSYGLALNRRFSSYYYEEDSDELYDLIDLAGNPIIDLIFSGFDLTVYNSTYSYSSLWTLDIPITVNYTFKSGFMIYGGGYVNYLLSAKNELEYEKHVPVFEVIDPDFLSIIGPEFVETLPKNETTYASNDSKNGFNEIDYGLLLGLGYTSNQWMIKLGYQYGINDVRSDDIQADISSHSAIQLSIGYVFSGIFSTSKEKPIYDLELIK